MSDGTPAAIAMLVESGKLSIDDLAAHQLDEIWNALFTSGGDDVELDVPIMWTLIRLGARRGGPITIEVSDLEPRAGCIQIAEKVARVSQQPASRDPIPALMDHTGRRGGSSIAASTADSASGVFVGVGIFLAIPLPGSCQQLVVMLRSFSRRTDGLETANCSRDVVSTSGTRNRLPYFTPYWTEQE